MAISIDTYGKLYEIISNLKDYNSPDKIEDLKMELKFIAENDDSMSVYIADYGDDIGAILSTANPSNIGYVFCFQGFTGNIGSFHDNLRIIPISTAFAGLDLQNSEIQNKGFFTGAYLRESNLSNSDLRHLDLTGIDLSYSNLQNAELANTKIHNANFIGANLMFASLPTYANTIEDFKKVVGNGNWDGETTIWTDGIPLDGFRENGAEP